MDKKKRLPCCELSYLGHSGALVADALVSLCARAKRNVRVPRRLEPSNAQWHGFIRGYLRINPTRRQKVTRRVQLRASLFVVPRGDAVELREGLRTKTPFWPPDLVF